MPGWVVIGVPIASTYEKAEQKRAKVVPRDLRLALTKLVGDSREIDLGSVSERSPSQNHYASEREGEERIVLA